MSSAETLPILRESMLLIVQRMGFKYFMLRGHFPQVDDSSDTRLDNCPPGWLEHCSQHGFESDPVHHCALQEGTPVVWRDWMTHYPDYFAAARKFGLVSGVTHPVHGPLGDRSSISFVKGVGGIQADREIIAGLSECQLIACYAHRVVARVIEKRLDHLNPASRPQRVPPVLTPRERECLSWVANGKTAAEVATTLSLSEATIIYHLTKARRKLDAENSRHAISKAISLKLIAPN
jgi:DNA-binding CsgD family transcriptional regulator